MKRFFHSWSAIVATLAMISPAVAQNDANGHSEIGSYQSILSRAGYSTSDVDGRGVRAYRPAGIDVAPSETAARPVRQEKADTNETVIMAPTNENAQPVPMAESVRLTDCDYGGCDDGDRYFVYDCDSGYCGSYTYSGRPRFRPFVGRFTHRLGWDPRE